MRILVFGLSSIHGGVESVILSFCRQALKKRVCEFDFVVIDEIPRFAAFLHDEYACNFLIVPNRLWHPVTYKQALKLALANGDYDFVWFNACTLSDITLLTIAKNYGVKCVLHSHNSENMGNFFNKVLHTIHKTEICNHVDIFCACSKEAASFMFPKSVYADRTKWKFIKNGIATKMFRFDPEKRNQIRKEHGLNDDILIGHVGRLHPQKNHKFILSVFEEFHASHPSSRLLLFGEGFLEDELNMQVHQRQLEDSIFFMGVQENISVWLSALDIFFFPSLYEGLPVALLEAQASGLPCLVSDVVPTEAICVHLVKRESLKKNPIIWCRDLEELLENRSFNSRGEAWKKVADAGFDVENEALSFFDFLKTE